MAKVVDQFEDVKQSPIDESGNYRWFEISYPLTMHDGTIHHVILGGRMRKDDAGRWEIDTVRGSTQAAGLVSDQLRSLHECSRIHEHITRELEKGL